MYQSSQGHVADGSEGPPLRVLLMHNFYQQPGGEDQVFLAEKKMLEDRGNEVLTHTVHNDAIKGMSPVALTRATFWNQGTYDQVRTLIRQRRPDVLHAHNTFPLISPSAYAAAREEHVPVVQTLHNYRLLCANGLLFREGAVCERCVSKTIPWPAVTGRCYRGSAVASAVAAGMVAYHRFKRTWAESVDLYIALTTFARDKFIAGGLPGERIVVKPNFVADQWHTGPSPTRRDHVLFVGRLAPEKGIRTMLDAWEASKDLPGLHIIGDGPLRDTVVAAAAKDPRIVWLGQQTTEQVRKAMRKALALLVPSLCYEGAPVVVVEAFAAGLPVIGSSHGALSAQIEVGVTGLHHRPGDARDLSRWVRWGAGNPVAMSGMGARAREHYLKEYSEAGNYRALLAIYSRVRRRAVARGRLRPTTNVASAL